MDQLDLHHEDVLLKMFMHSFDSDACQWYSSLPHSSISSLKEFHTTFKEHCKRYFSVEFLFENCCAEYELHIKDIIDGNAGNVNEKEIVDEIINEKSIILEYFFDSFA
jgi:hypothetical protein